jgi:hypothetical protein
LLPNFHANSFLSKAFCAADSANGAAGLAGFGFGVITVGLTSESLFCGPEGDWPRLERATSEANPSATNTSVAVRKT